MTTEPEHALAGYPAPSRDEHKAPPKSHGGEVVVPREATDEMLIVGAHAIIHADGARYADDAAAVWKAMLSAVPLRAPDGGSLRPSDCVPTEGGDDPWAELEKLAKAATPGPWEYGDDGPILYKGMLRPVWNIYGGRPYIDNRLVGSVEHFDEDSHPNDNAAFIAAANPATVLALIAAVRSSRGGYGGAAVVQKDPSAGDQWQGIETAPRDGTRVLFWDARRKVAVSGCWHVEPGMDTPNAYEPGWAWWTADDDLITWDGGPDDAPIHWMPLPPPPARMEGEG